VAEYRPQGVVAGDVDEAGDRAAVILARAGRALHGCGVAHRDFHLASRTLEAGAGQIEELLERRLLEELGQGRLFAHPRLPEPVAALVRIYPVSHWSDTSHCSSIR